MATVSVTYTFTNGTTADADEVNTNFTDLINGTSDGTKDFSIAALTVAGAATLNGDVTLGNSSGDDITIIGSIAADIPFKTNATYDIGATGKGPALIYLASGSNTLALGVKSSISTNFSLQLPGTQGSSGDQMMNEGSGDTVWQPNAFGFTSNLGLAVATTTTANDSIKITGAAAALSSTNPGYIVIASTTAGLLTTFKVTADVTIDLTGAHWGFGTKGDLTDYVLHVFALNNDGTLTWGVGAQSGRSIILNADDDNTGTNITSWEKVLVKAALTADAQSTQLGYFKANFDDTGGASEDIWAVQSGDGDLIVTSGRMPIITPWISSPLTIGAVTTPPTKASTTIFDLAHWRRVGDSMHFKYSYRHDASAGSAAGSGAYLFPIPLGLDIDLAKMNSQSASQEWQDVCGTGVATTGAPQESTGHMRMYDLNNLLMVTIEDTSGLLAAIGSAFIPINANALVRYSFIAEIPISGWNVF